MIPFEIIPLLEKTGVHLRNSLRGSHDFPIEFWLHDNEDVIEEGYYYLSDELVLSELDAEDLPIGYKLVGYLFGWESSCSNEGWDAFDNLQDGEIDEIISGYRIAGLSAEADAVRKAYLQWQQTPDDHDRIGASYSSVPNKFAEDYDRIPHLVRHLTENSNALFHRTET